MTEPLELWLVDTFTDRALSGSTAGVVLGGARLAGEEMQAIAAEIRAPASIFLVGRVDGRPRFRSFTPATEIDRSASAIIAALSTLVWSGNLALADAPLVLSVETRAGSLPVELRREPAGLIRVGLDLAGPQVTPFPHARDLLAAVLGVEREQLQEHWPLALAAALDRFLVVPLVSRRAVDGARPDFDNLAELNRKQNVVGTFVYTWQGPADLYCRGFTPRLGIPEDPATGTGMAAAAAALVAGEALILTPPVTPLRFEQVSLLGRGGMARAEVHHGPAGIARVRISGTAALALRGQLHVP